MSRHRISAVIGMMCCVTSTCSSPTSLLDEQALSRAEARWAARSFDSYSYETVTSCGECPTEVARQTRVEVRSGIVSAAVVVVNDSLLPTVAGFMTIDGLFAKIRGYPRDVWLSEVRVDFDPQLGYPTKIRVFGKPGIMDAGYDVFIGRLVPSR